jgi:hypothetical protein
VSCRDPCPIAIRSGAGNFGSIVRSRKTGYADPPAVAAILRGAMLVGALTPVRRIDTQSTAKPAVFGQLF